MSAKRDIIPLFVPHLGCRNDCVFCNQRKISGCIEPVDAARTIKAVTEARRAHPDKQFELAFYGGSFTAIPEGLMTELLTAARGLLDAGDLVSVRVSTRPDCIDDNKLLMLRQYGVGTIELGVQSMDAEVLRASGRGHTAEDSVRAMRLVKAHGFTLIAQMMTGLPGDSREKALGTARLIADERPDGVRIYPTVVIRDTELYSMYMRGEYEPQTVDGAASLCAELIAMLEDSGVPVLRCGLNPSDELSGGEAVAGAYHPALGELARSRIFLDKAKKLLDAKKYISEVKSVTLGVNKSCVSLMTGQKRRNIERLKAEYGLDVRVRETNIPPGEVRIL